MTLHRTLVGVALPLVAAVFLAASVAPSAAARRPFTPGEQQTSLDGSGVTLAIFPAGAGQILAQTFTPRTNQRLGFLQLPVGCSEGVQLNVKVREGIDGPILFEADASGLPVVVGGSFQLIQVYDPARGPRGIKLRKNRIYAFELAATSTDPEGTCGIMRGPIGTDSYSGGDGYYEDPPTNGPGFIPLGSGEDLPFVTLVR